MASVGIEVHNLAAILVIYSVPKCIAWRTGLVKQLPLLNSYEQLNERLNISLIITEISFFFFFFYFILCKLQMPRILDFFGE